MLKFLPFFLQGFNLFITALLGLIFLPLISQKLMVGEVGLYAQMLSIFSLGILLVNSGTNNFNYRFLNNNNYKNFKNSFLTLLISIIVSVCIINLYFIISTDFNLFDVAIIIVLLLLFGVFKFFHSILYANQLHMEFVTLNLIEATTRYLLALFFVYMGLNYTSYFIANIISSLGILIVLVVFFRETIISYIRYKGEKGITLIFTLKYTTLYTASGLALWVLTSIDILLIGYILDKDQVGIYTLGYTLGFQVVIFILMILNNVLEPKILSKSKVEIKDYYFLNKVFINIAIPLMIFILINVDFYYALIINENFHESSKITKLILFSSFLWGIYKLTSIKFAKDLNPALFTKLVITASLINIILNVILIQKIGIVGAAFSSLISYLFLAVMAWFYVFSTKLILKLVGNILIITIVHSSLLILINYLTTNEWVNQIIQLSVISMNYLTILLLIRRGKF